MKILSVLGILIVSLILGFVIRSFIKKKQKAKVIMWLSFVVFWSVFLIYSLMLTLKEDSPLFTKHHMANELFVISSTIFLIISIILLRKSLYVFPDANEDHSDLPVAKKG